ncbi:MAG: SDR family oxidoreductase [Eubacteriaceae bacterium]|nr:SDR family oxidoreductase [Eubacteriaceae bacterium]
MDIDLKGYSVFLTGGSSGLGYEMARALLEKGATVAISARGKERLAKAHDTLKGYGDVRSIQMDVRDEASVRTAAEWFSKDIGKLNMLINNAGIGGNEPGLESLPSPHSFYDIPVSSVRNVIETNLIGYFTVTKYFIPFMLGGNGGSIVYVTTSDATMVRKGQIPYGPSKAGAEAMCAIMSQELSDKGIDVNLLCPGGFTDTAMAPKGLLESHLRNGNTVLKPDVMNEAILFLASPRAKGITGEKIVGKSFDQWLRDKGL